VGQQGILYEYVYVMPIVTFCGKKDVKNGRLV